ncbi:MAG: hypothetical protein IKK87_02480 [Bacteroidaceae bacterium]|nr:hypothetical protein [Bacteroidaceae bacterium]
MTKVNIQHKQAYICPAIEVVNIDMQQAILAGSGQIETIGDTKEEMEWSNARRGEGWGNLWE